jgi:hypothetical protein
VLATVTAAVVALAAGCSSGSQGGSLPGQSPSGQAATASASPATRPAGAHGGVNLNVLVLTDGTGGVEAIRQELSSEGMPETVINLHDSSRPKITGSFLSRTLPDGTRGGNFDGVVLPSAAPAGLSPAEMQALARYESRFRVRQVDAYVPPSGAVGLNPPDYSGAIGGVPVTLTSAAKAAGFGYLKGSFTVTKPTTGYPPYGYIARPLAGSPFTPVLTAKVPGTSTTGTLAGVYTTGRQQELEFSLTLSYYQPEFRYLGPGIVDWLTRGVHLGYWRNYFTVDYDDIFNADAQWSTKGHCDPVGGATGDAGGAGACPAGTPATAPIRMNPSDVTYAVNWERQHHFTIEWLFNGGPSARFLVHGVDPLLAAMKPVAKDFWWVNHTYNHAYLGCAQNFAVSPWQCKKSGGQYIWASEALINSETVDNLTWARRNGIPADPRELATGEYSGLRFRPQQPVDNPNLIKAINADHIKWIALDASRDPSLRPVGGALGVPRYPINVGYDADTVAEEVSEYNWIYTAKADGGSGLCQTLKKTTCIKPLDPRTGWQSYILPAQVQNVLAKVLANDPRPFFMHQSNLTAGRLGYPVMNGVLSAYRSVYAASAPIVNQPLWGAGKALQAQQQWANALRSGAVSAWVEGGTLTISGPAGTAVPVTLAGNPRIGHSAVGSSWGGDRSGHPVLGSKPLRITLGSAPYPATAGGSS